MGGWIGGKEVGYLGREQAGNLCTCTSEADVKATTEGKWVRRPG